MTPMLFHDKETIDNVFFTCSSWHNRLHDDDGLRTAWDWVHEDGDGDFSPEEVAMLKRRLLKRPSLAKCAERIGHGFDASGSGAGAGVADAEGAAAQEDRHGRCQVGAVLHFCHALHVMRFSPAPAFVCVMLTLPRHVCFVFVCPSWREQNALRLLPACACCPRLGSCVRATC